MELLIMALTITGLLLLVFRQEIKIHSLQKDIGEVFEIVATELLTKKIKGNENGSKMDKTGD